MIIVVPGVLPGVTRPPVRLIVATVALPLVHVPPAGLDESKVVKPRHAVRLPLMLPGFEYTFCVVVL